MFTHWLAKIFTHWLAKIYSFIHTTPTTNTCTFIFFELAILA